MADFLICNVYNISCPVIILQTHLRGLLTARLRIAALHTETDPQQIPSKHSESDQQHFWESVLPKHSDGQFERQRAKWLEIHSLQACAHGTASPIYSLSNPRRLELGARRQWRMWVVVVVVVVHTVIMAG